VRHANANGDGFTDSDTYADFNAYSDSCSYSDGYGYGYANGDSYTDGNADSDADVPAGRHTRAVGYRRARATHSISRWWNDRWNLRLRLRWPNLHRRLP